MAHKLWAISYGPTFQKIDPRSQTRGYYRSHGLISLGTVLDSPRDRQCVDRNPGDTDFPGTAVPVPRPPLTLTRDLKALNLRDIYI